jgi:hypothetical protein
LIPEVGEAKLKAFIRFAHKSFFILQLMYAGIQYELKQIFKISLHAVRINFVDPEWGG